MKTFTKIDLTLGMSSAKFINEIRDKPEKRKRNEMGKYGIFGVITYRDTPRNEQLLFNGITFNSFLEGWDWIYANDPNDNDEEHYYDDYFVELIEKEID